MQDVTWYRTRAERQLGEHGSKFSNKEYELKTRAEAEAEAKAEVKEEAKKAPKKVAKKKTKGAEE